MTGGIEPLEYLNGINIRLPCGSGPIVPCDNAVREVFPQQRLHQVAGNVGKSRSRKGDLKIPCAGSVKPRFRELRFTSSEIPATDRIHCASCTFRFGVFASIFGTLPTPKPKFRIKIRPVQIAT